MGKMTSTGVVLSVSAAEPATFDQAGYEALTFTEVGELIDFPEFGPTIQVVESNPLKTGITEKRPGFTNMGSVSLGLELDISDAGQGILEAGLAIPPAAYVEHSFQVDYPDGTVEYFTGGIYSYTRSIGSANSMIGSTAQIEINTQILRVTTP